MAKTIEELEDDVSWLEQKVDDLEVKIAQLESKFDNYKVEDLPYIIDQRIKLHQ